MITTNKMDWVTCTAWIKLEEEFGPRAIYDGVAICLMSELPRLFRQNVSNFEGNFVVVNSSSRVSGRAFSVNKYYELAISMSFGRIVHES